MAGSYTVEATDCLIVFIFFILGSPAHFPYPTPTPPPRHHHPNTSSLFPKSKLLFKFKSSVFQGWYSKLLQHAPAAQLPRLHLQFLAKNMLRNKTFAPEFCSLISNWFDMREQAPGANLLHESASGASSLVCTEIWLLWHDVSPVGQSNWLNLLVPMPQSGCFIIQIPRSVLRVYWLGYLPGSVFLELVSGASSFLCTGLQSQLVNQWLLFARPAKTNKKLIYTHSRNIWTSPTGVLSDILTAYIKGNT